MIIYVGALGIASNKKLKTSCDGIIHRQGGWMWGCDCNECPKCKNKKSRITTYIGATNSIDG